MEPVLLQHSSATAGPLALRGIIAAATVFAETGFDRPSQSSPSSHFPSSQSAGIEPAKGVLKDADSPTISANGLAMTSSLLTALPGVMACYSCHTQSAAQAVSSDTIQQGNELLQGLDRQLQPILKLLKADARLMLPFIAALVSQCQLSIGLSDSTGASHPQYISQTLVHACDETHEGGVSTSAEYARQAEGGLGESVTGPAARDGGDKVVAAVGVLLVLCEEQALLVQILGLLQPLSEACSTLRYAVLPSCNLPQGLCQSCVLCYRHAVRTCRLYLNHIHLCLLCSTYLSMS